MVMLVVVWDFDGVIFDSMHLKCEGFKTLFKRHSKANQEVLKAFEDYHYTSGGIGRAEKIAYFYNYILKQPLKATQIQTLVDEFGQIITKDLFSKEHLNQDVLHFIKAHYQNCTFHIASAALHSELQILCEFLGLLPYFRSIEGSPPSKAKVLANLKTAYGYTSQEMLLIGDSKSDYESARVNNISFLGYNSAPLQDMLPQAYITSFQGLDLKTLATKAGLNQF
ncbi:HAD family hydrolase [Helicobacter suis]|uniref:HAD family hydrolase n=1 Tax=Helicobacter suis TaxID=104628 RepID=UPI000CF08A09|nr:HAD hydrolase-like protein [Helicobacter suis]